MARTAKIFGNLANYLYPVLVNYGIMFVVGQCPENVRGCEGLPRTTNSVFHNFRSLTIPLIVIVGVGILAALAVKISAGDFATKDEFAEYRSPTEWRPWVKAPAE